MTCFIREIKLEKNYNLEMRWVKDLHPSPYHEEIYGNGLPEDLEDSIRKEGVLQPLVITEDGEILSGRSRWRICKSIGIEEVPCLIRQEKNLASEEKLATLINLNASRDRTPRQRAIEYRHLKIVEACRLKKNPGQYESTPRKVAAKKVGMSPDSCEALLDAIDQADDLASRGKMEEASALNKAIDSGSIKSVKEASSGLGGKKPSATKKKPKSKLDVVDEKIEQAMVRLGRLIKERGDLSEACGKPALKAWRNLDKSFESWRTGDKST